MSSSLTNGLGVAPFFAAAAGPAKKAAASISAHTLFDVSFIYRSLYSLNLLQTTQLHSSLSDYRRPIWPCSGLPCEMATNLSLPPHPGSPRPPIGGRWFLASADFGAASPVAGLCSRQRA